jgi:hypothetical protein
MHIEDLKKKHIDVLIRLSQRISFKGKSKFGQNQNNEKQHTNSLSDSLIIDPIKSNEQKINSSQNNIDRNEVYDTRKIIELIIGLLNKNESIS